MPVADVKCPKCGAVASYDRYCGAHVCSKCEHHVGLTRCYCGWSESGGDGRQELEDWGRDHRSRGVRSL